MRKFVVGNGAGMLSLKQAVNKASSGDVIEFVHANYNENIGDLIIDKNLTLVGYKETRSDELIHYLSVLKGKLFINNRANVVLQNLWINDNRAQNSLIYCSDGVNLQIQSVVLYNMQNQGEVCPIIYCQDSEISAFNLKIKDVTYGYNTVYALRSKLSLDKSALNNCVCIGEKSELNMTDSTDIFAAEANCIYLVNGSTATMQNTRIEGSNPKCVLVYVGDGSSLSASKCVFKKPGYVGSVTVQNKSDFNCANSDITSVYADNSKCRLSGCVVRETITALNHSAISIDSDIDLRGENSVHIDICVDTNSVVYGDVVCLNRIVDPNISVRDKSLCAIKELRLKDGDSKCIVTDIDDTSLFFCGNLHTIVAKQDLTGALVQEPVADGQAQERKQTSNAKQTLDNLIGLTSVKKEIDRMISIVNLNKKRVEKGLKPEEISLHSVFMGNPGTGKTTVARMIGEILWEAGAFTGESFTFIEATEPDLVSSNVGGTAEKTSELLEKAKGGVLFIDEAYALNKKDAAVNFGQEAINTILKYMEDHRNDIMIIFAGYTKEMEQFLKTNPGLESRVPNKFVFEDYTPEEIVQMGEKELDAKGYVFEEAGYYRQLVKQAYKNSLDHSNGRWIRNINERLVRVMAERLGSTGEDDIFTIKNVDIKAVFDIGKYQEDAEDALESLDKLIGIANVKQQVRDFIAMAELNQKREDQGLDVNGFTLHSLFLGNPGTGKTTVARIIGKILYQKNIIATNKFIEVSRTELVAGYVGQTAAKTREVLESALGGVLFIDEAYALHSGHGNDFGQEAVDEILKFMEDHRKDIVIIFAGYTKEMGEFLQMNSGLKSRVPNTFDFEDYTTDDLMKIGLLQLSGQQYKVEETAYRDAMEKCFEVSNDYSNGRWVRNFDEKIIRLMSRRLAAQPNDDITLITDEDLQAVIRLYMNDKE